MRWATNRGLLAIGLFLVSLPCAADTWYVNVANQSGPQDGKSWATPFSTIQPAIDAAHAAGGGEVWVARGTYGEPRSYLEDGIETGALRLRSGVALYGAFAGNEERRTIRDIERNISVISGKTSRGGSRAYHVVVGADGAEMDGFVIRDGFANGENRNQRIGGGLLCMKGKVTIENCVFADNKAFGAGGGAYLERVEPKIVRCEFRRNEVVTPPGESRNGRYGGGLRLTMCPNAVIRSCGFVENANTNDGGGLYSKDSFVVVAESVFERNHVRSLSGGATFVGAAVSLTDCTFTENTSSRWVGGLQIGSGGVATIENCRFNRNSAALKGGALSLWNAGKSTVTKCAFIGNRADGNDGAALLIEESTLIVSGSTFEDNWSPAGAAATISGSTLELERCTFQRNLGSTFAKYKNTDSLTLVNSRVNSTGGKLMWLYPTSQPLMTLADGQRVFSAWTGNIDLAEPVALPAPPTPPRHIASAPVEPDTISIKTDKAEISVSGSNTVLYALSALIAVVFLVLAFGWIYIAQRRGGQAA